MKKDCVILILGTTITCTWKQGGNIWITIFLPLGGAAEVGASAYFVQVDGVRMLFDCGARINGNERYPDYRAMLDVIDDYGQLAQQKQSKTDVHETAAFLIP